MTVSYKLGNVALPYLYGEWPKYRGTLPRVVAWDAPADAFHALATLARSLGGQPTTLTIEAPSGAGSTAGTTSVTIAGIYILRVVKVNRQTCTVYLSDARIVLSRLVGDMDFRVRFGDGYLEGTDYSSWRSAVAALVDSLPEVTRLAAGDAFVDFSDSIIRDQQFIAGLPAMAAFETLLDQSGNDLTVRTAGHYAFVGREDLTTKLPLKSLYAWQKEPSWEPLDTVLTGVPRSIRVYSHERHCLRMKGYNDDPTATRSRSGPAELQIELEQVYNDEGEIRTLSELLTANGFTDADLTDELIGKYFWTENFEGAPIADSYGTASFDRVHMAVRADWRRLWRIIYPSSKGHIGGWTDWAFGKINADGTSQPVAVECPWVEFLVELQVKDGAEVLGSELTINHAEQSPFAVQWEGDVSSGVVRFVQREKLRGSVAIPGALTAPLKVERKTTVTNGKDEAYKLDDFILIEREDIGKARFVKAFECSVYACATKRAPNNETRWHVEAVSSGLAGADIDHVELPPGEVICVRDFVDNNALSDGLGPLLNAQEVLDDATIRADVWKQDFMATLDGEGVAESIMLFRDTEVRGPIREVALMFDGVAVRSRIMVGNLANAQRRREVARRRVEVGKGQVAGI